MAAIGLPLGDEAGAEAEATAVVDHEDFVEALKALAEGDGVLVARDARPFAEV